MGVILTKRSKNERQGDSGLAFLAIAFAAAAAAAAVLPSIVSLL